MEQDRKEQPENPAAPAVPDSDQTQRLKELESQLQQSEQTIEHMFGEVDQAHRAREKAEAERRLEEIKNEALNSENMRLRMENEVLVTENAELRAGRERDQQTIANLAQEWEEKNKEAYEAKFDKLTGLFGTEFFDFKLEEFLTREKRTVRFALGYIDLAYFKEVNDEYGHEAGNDVLRQVGGIVNSIRESHPEPARDDRRYLPRKGEYDIARRGGTGDEFVFLVAEVASLADCRLLALRLNQRIAQIRVKDKHVVEGDMGIITLEMCDALRQAPKQTVFQLKRWAEYYMYQAKNYSKGLGLNSQSKTRRIAVKDLPVNKLFQEPPELKKQKGR